MTLLRSIRGTMVWSTKETRNIYCAFYTTETSRDFKDATRKMNEKFKFFTKFAQKQKQETLNCYLLVLFITQIKSYLKMGKDNELTIYRQSPIFFITN